MISPQRITAILDRMSHRTILVAGDTLLDRYLFGSVERISPEAPVPVLQVREEVDRLGGAGNVALNIDRL
ncbi:MAG TPA: D-glycero-beta-D-manno-heptose-7-phosphate kinase, partial [Candidatus Aminicenantes bacterium]|nr:D-glycero-beta-D-manno-heptose-7-phosphate kinase [Candidatus Aminicenantes bacterium]